MAQALRPDWIGIDWGTSRLRAWALDREGALLAALSSNDGMGGLQSDAFEGKLIALIEPWLGDGTVPVLACGMVGSRQGWIEAPYNAVPCAALSDGIITAPTRDRRLSVRLIPGLKQASPPDVIRGEETQIAGFLQRNPGFDGVICLPGTHTKWVHVSANEVVSFQTFMTGELFATLGRHSILRHSVAQDGWDEAAFLAAVDDVMSRPERLAGRLFTLRAAALLDGLDGVTSRARLSGYLIGAELAAARPYWLGQAVALIGETRLSHSYAAALSQTGVDARMTDATEMTLAGLTAAYRSLKEPAE